MECPGHRAVALRECVLELISMGRFSRWACSSLGAAGWMQTFASSSGPQMEHKLHRQLLHCWRDAVVSGKHLFSLEDRGPPYQVGKQPIK